MIGSVLEGRYRVLQKEGENLMFQVYLVEHIHLGRYETLKILQPAVASQP